MTKLLRKKILIVRPTMGQGGADRVTLILLQYLDSNEFDTSLLLMRKEGAHLDNIPAHIKVYDARAGSLWFFLPSILKTIKELKPDIVFSTCGGANMPLAIAGFFKPFRKWKVILSERNILFPPGKNKFKRSVMLIAKAFFYRFADVLTSVSEGVRNDMRRKLGISVKRIMVLNNPVIDNALYEQAEESVLHPWFSENKNIPVIVNAGRFVHQKDHTTLIKAFALVRQRFPCRLFLLGDGPLLHSVQKLVSDMNLSPDVFFAGFDVNPYKYMARCDAFVLSSLHEGMPGVLIQAMACGAPSISTNCPSGPDEIIDKPGENGILVPVGNPDALASAMEKVLVNRAFVNKLRTNGPLAVKKFEVAEAMTTYIAAINA